MIAGPVGPVGPVGPAPLIDLGALRAVLRRYPALGEFRGVVRNGLSANTPACLFETARGVFFLKRYDPAWRDPAGLAAELELSARLAMAGFPTPRLHEAEGGEPFAWHLGAAYAIFDPARGVDRYHDRPVFAPFDAPEEARSAGATLARFHLALGRDLYLPPRPMKRLCARFRLPLPPGPEAGLAALWAEAPKLRAFAEPRPEWPWLMDYLAPRAAALAPLAGAWPRGVIHGDFIKRNLFWDGTQVADVIDFDLAEAGAWVFDLALALLPCGFDWPRLLASGEGVGPEAIAATAEMLAGYASVRPLEPAERAALPVVMESARVEFYLSAALFALERELPEEAERFWALLVGTTGWFAAHPEWRAAFAEAIG